jgi:hypothetical protein
MSITPTTGMPAMVPLTGSSMAAGLIDGAAWRHHQETHGFDLCGGNKATQRKDIADATRLWQDYRSGRHAAKRAT